MTDFVIFRVFGQATFGLGGKVLEDKGLLASVTIITDEEKRLATKDYIKIGRRDEAIWLEN